MLNAQTGNGKKPKTIHNLLHTNILSVLVYQVFQVLARKNIIQPSEWRWHILARTALSSGND